MSKYDSKPGGIGAHPNHEHAVHYRATIDAKPVQDEVKKVRDNFQRFNEELRKYHQEGLKRDKEALDSVRRTNEEERKIHSERVRRDREIIDSSRRRGDAERDAVRRTIRSITDLNEARKEAGRAGDESAQSYLREFRRRVERDGRNVSKDVIREVANDLKREFSRAGEEAGGKLVQSFSNASRKVSESVRFLNDEITRAGRSTRKMGEEGEQSAERIRKSVSRVREDVKNLNDVMNRLTVKPVEFKAESQKLMRELDRVEERLRKISDKDANVKVRATAEEAFREFDRVSSRLRQIDDEDATVDVTARVDDAIRSADRVRDRFSRLRDEAFTTVEVRAQIDDVVRKANEVSERLRRIDAEDAEVDIRAVADQAMAEINEVQRALERVDDESATIDVKVAKENAVRELAFVKERVEDLNRSAAEIDLRVSSAGAINSINLVRNMIREVDEEDANIEIDANIAPIMLKMQEVESRIRRIDDESATIDVNLEIEQARRASEEVLNIIRNLKDDSASIPVRMQLEEWERGVQRVTGDLDRIRNSSAQIQIDAATTAFNQKIEEVQARLNQLRETSADPIEIQALIEEAITNIDTVEQRLLEIQAQPTSAQVDANIASFLAKTQVVKSSLSDIASNTTTARIVADAEEAIGQIQEFRENTEAVSNKPIVTKVTADTAGADNAIQGFTSRTVTRSGAAGRQAGVSFVDNLNRQLRAVGAPEIDLKANPSDALNDISTVKTELNRMVREAPTLELKLTYQNLLRQVENVRRTVTREFEGMGRDSMYAMRREWENSLTGLSRRLDSMTNKIWRLKVHTDPQGALRGIQGIERQMVQLSERARIIGERTGNEHATAISRRMALLQQEMRRLPLEFYANPFRFYRDLAKVRAEISKANRDLKVVARAEMDAKQFDDTLRNVDRSVRDMDARAIVNIKVGVDRPQVSEARRLMFQLIQPDQQMATAMVSVFTRFFTTVIRFVFARPIIWAPLIPALAHAIVEGTAFIGAALTGAILAGLNIGAIAAGIALIADDPRVQAGFNALRTKALSTFRGLAEVFIDPLIRSFGHFGAAVERIAPSIQRIFANLAPAVEKFAVGLVGLVENALPGIERAILASQPLLEMLAQMLPEVGKHIESFFTKLSDPKVVEGATLALKDAITLFLYFMDVVGSLLASLSKAWAEFRPLLAEIKDLMDDLGLSTKSLGDLLSALGTGIMITAAGGLNQFKTFLEGIRTAIDAIPGPLEGLGLKILQFTGIVGEKGEADKKAKEEAESHAREMERFREALQNSHGHLLNYKDALSGAAAELTHVKTRQNDLSDDLAAMQNFYTAMSDGASDSQEKAKAFADALREIYEEQQNLEQATQDREEAWDSFQETFREGAQNARDNARALEENNQKIGELDEKLRTGEVSLEEYNREVGSLKDENAELARTAGESATSLDKTTEAGRKGRDALKELAGAERDATTAMIASGTPYEEALADHAKRLESLRAEAKELGLNQEETEKLVKLYGDIPKELNIHMTTTGYAEVYQQMQDLKSLEASIASGKSLADAERDVESSKARAVAKGFNAGGGMLDGPGSGTSDSIPIMASKGEFVTKAASVSYYGADAMHAINKGRADRDTVRKAAGFASGGQVGVGPVQRFAAGGTVLGTGVIQREFRYTVGGTEEAAREAEKLGEIIATKIREGISGSSSGKDVSGVGKQIFEEIKKGIEESLPQAIEVGKTIVSKISEGIKGVSVGGESENIGKSIIDGISKGLNAEGLAAKFQEIGKSIMDGLFKGINDTIGGTDINGMVKGVVDKLVGGFKNLLGIASPSKVMMEIGEQTAEGFQVGYEKQNAETDKLFEKVLERLKQFSFNAINYLKNMQSAGGNINQSLKQSLDSSLDMIKLLEKEYRETLDAIGSDNPELSRKIGKQIDQVFTIFEEAEKALKSGNQGMADELVRSGIELADIVTKNMRVIQNNFFQGFKDDRGTVELAGTFKQLGKNLSDGTMKGLEESNPALLQYMVSWAENLPSTVKDTLGIKSPSTVMAELGKNLVEGLMQGIVEALPRLNSTWGEAMKGIQDVANTMKAKIDEIFNQVRDAIRQKMNEIRQNVDTILNKDIRTMWDQGWKQINDTSNRHIEATRKGAAEGFTKIKNLATDLKNHVVREFNALGGGITGGINGAIDVLNRAIDAVNKILPKDMPRISRVSGPSSTPSAGNQGFAAANRRAGGGAVSDKYDDGRRATGGPIYGPGTSQSDDIATMGPGGVPYRLSNGEHIWTAHEVRKMGGHERMSEIRRAIRDGKTDTAFAVGGAIERATGGAVELITALGRKFGAGGVTSSYRNTPDYHGQGKAVDFGGYNQDSAASKFLQFGRGLLELIHQTKEGGRRVRYSVKHGVAGYTGYDSLYNSPDASINHSNHIHVAANADRAQMILEGKLPKDAGAPPPSGSAGGSYSYVDEEMVKKAKKAMNDALQPMAGIMREFQANKLINNAVKTIFDLKPIKEGVEKHIQDAATVQASFSSGASGDPKVMADAYATAKKLNASRKVLLALFETGFVESGFRNLGHLGSKNDHDSLGFLQQRPSSGWGSPSQIMNVPYATNSFVRRAQAKEGAHRTAGTLAQSVQVSAFPERYAQHRSQAVDAIKRFDPKFDPNGYAYGGAIEDRKSGVYPDMDGLSYRKSIEDRLFGIYKSVNNPSDTPTPRTLSPAAATIVNNNATTNDRGGLHFENITINNPVPERTTESLRNTINKTALLFDGT